MVGRCILILIRRPTRRPIIARLVAAELLAVFEPVPVVIVKSSTAMSVMLARLTMAIEVGRLRRRNIGCRSRIWLIRSWGVRSRSGLRYRIWLIGVTVAHWSGRPLRIAMIEAHANWRSHHLRLCSSSIVVTTASTAPARRILAVALLRWWVGAPLLSRR